MSLRLDEQGINELLARAQNILKDTELVAAAARMTETPSAAGDSAMPRPQESQKCYRCGGPNHYSKDCQSRGTREAQMIRKHGSDCTIVNVTGWATQREIDLKQVWGQGAIVSLASYWPVNVALPINKIQVSAMFSAHQQKMFLIDS